MGLRATAIDSAHAQDAERKAKNEEKDRATGVKMAAELTERYGWQFTWIGRVHHERFRKQTDSWGGSRWRPHHERTFDRFGVDDVFVLLDQSGVLYVESQCPNCYSPFPNPLGYASSKGLETAIGKALTSDVMCTRCQAKPCPTCGRA